MKITVNDCLKSGTHENLQMLFPNAVLNELITEMCALPYETLGLLLQ